MKKILVVDDEQVFLNLMARVLGESGYRVATAGGGEEGFAAVGSARPDLVVTDLIMPGLDGVQLIRKLKEGYAGIPVIAMSGGGRTLDTDLTLKSVANLGVKAILRKPFSHDDLLQAVDEALAAGHS